MYRLGEKVTIHLYGKSHGGSVGCILDGIPQGIGISQEKIAEEMSFRRPSQGIGTSRLETDEVIVKYGIRNGITDGLPIHLAILNADIRSAEYEIYNNLPRPGHADLPSIMKFGHSLPGGGPFSGRLTAPIVAAGSVAKQFISTLGIEVIGFARSIGNITDTSDRNIGDAWRSRDFSTRACDERLDTEMKKEIENAKISGDSVGGVAECVISKIPAGFGGMWFDALDSEISRAMFSIPGVKGVEFGKGFDISKMKGSESNDAFFVDGDEIHTRTNNMGGILGGMGSGMPIVFRVAFKPTPSISVEQDTVDLRVKENTKITVMGRHDACIVPRAVSVVEAMAALVVADQAVRS